MQPRHKRQQEKQQQQQQAQAARVPGLSIGLRFMQLGGCDTSRAAAASSARRPSGRQISAVCKKHHRRKRRGRRTLLENARRRTQMNEEKEEVKEEEAPLLRKTTKRQPAAAAAVKMSLKMKIAFVGIVAFCLANFGLNPADEQQQQRRLFGPLQVAHCSPQVFSSSLSAAAKLLGAAAGQTPAQSSAEIHQVRGLSGAGRIELPCLVDQLNCGEVYYITWTRQSTPLHLNGSSSSSPSSSMAPQHVALQQQQQQWSRVYLYTGANDSAPHKPIGDLVNRATFVMPDNSGQQRRASSSPSLSDNSDNIAAEERDSSASGSSNSPFSGAPPVAKLVIEEPRLSDEALYKCDVTYVRGKCPSISLVRVQMMQLPAKAQISVSVASDSSSGGGGRGGLAAAVPAADGQLIGPYNEHEQLQLTCLVHGGRPAPKSVIWRKIDATGRTINLMPPVARATKQQQQEQLSQQQQQQQQQQAGLVQVELNHTLTSSDLGARFECHVEHEAIEQPTARVVVSNELASSGSGGGGRHSLADSDSMLDLHPSSRKLDERQDGNDEQQGDGSQQHQSAAGQLRSKSLDSHVFVDLNVGVASLDLFMAKVNRRNSSEPLKEGDLVELECVAYNSKPPANITWFNGSDSIEQFDSTALSTATTVTDSGAAGGANWPQQQQQQQRQPQKPRLHKRLLQRNQVHQNGDGQTYTTHSFLSIRLSRHEHKAQIFCQAQNGPMRAPLVKSLELQVQHAPIVLMEPAAGITVSEAAPAAVASTASGLDLGGLASPQRRQDLEQPSERGAGDSGGGGAAALMLGPPGANSLASYAAAAAEVPDSVSIYCIYSANPAELAPNSTRWFKDGQQLSGVEQSAAADSGAGEQQLQQRRRSLLLPPHLSESVTATGYPVLTIRQVNRRDAGLYDCQLSNAIGTSERLPASEACKLEVNFRPAVQLRLFKPPMGAAAASGGAPSSSYSMDELSEVDLDQELILPGSAFVFVCDVLEAQPNKIQKFHWHRAPLVHRAAPTSVALGPPAGGRGGGAVGVDGELASATNGGQLISITESGQFVLNPLAANFTPASFSCSAFNSLGASERSNRIEIQLSYAPGPSYIRPVTDATLRKVILTTGRPAPQLHSSSTDASGSMPAAASAVSSHQTIGAGKELLLECVTPDLGQPRANIWLWFKNEQPIESSAATGQSDSNNPSTTSNSDDLISSANDNPITGHHELSATTAAAARDANNNNDDNQMTRRNGSPSPTGTQETRNQHSRIRLISSGRYLFIPSIQLVHKGNYSCVAVNRLGSGLQQQQQSSASSSSERDSYQLRVALAPSFVQPLASRTYWPEVPLASEYHHQKQQQQQQSSLAASGRQLELVCHVQCDPICQIDWLRNNEPLDSRRQSEGLGSNYVTHQVKQTIMDENLATNMFRSVESKLVLQFHDGGQNRLDSNNRQLERRLLLSGANYTCQSSSNSMGPPVRSTTKFIVQYPPENVLINAPSDKLSLVEGSNGPRLSCEASAEPQVQYRWFLLKGSSSASNAANAANLPPKYKPNKRSSSISQSSGAAVAAGEQDHAINQVASKAFDVGSLFGSGARGANDAAGMADQNLIELTSSATEQGAASSSVLDLSNLGIDRRQAGHYICEASNRLGSTRQSVYVNVLYKPTCATLHLHSLDLTIAPPMDSSGKSLSGQQQDGGNYIRAKPFKATSNDEYSIVRETSDDFIDLRKVLVLSPLLNRYPHSQPGATTTTTTNSDNDEELSFRGSIFQTILNDKKAGVGSGGGGNKVVSDKDALIHMEDKLSDKSHHHHLNNLLVPADEPPNTNGPDSWDRFNMLLLKFLNSYMRQVKNYEEQMIEASLKRESRDKRQSRRSSQSYSSSIDNQQQQQQSRGDQSASNRAEAVVGHEFDAPRFLAGGKSTKNLLTFACMAQDGNPMSNLTFDWSFGSTNLPETGASGDSPMDSQLDSTNSLPNEPQQSPFERDGPTLSSSVANSKPVLVYTNENYTLHVMLVRRMDTTRSSLNPFQMSLLTLNVVVVAEPPPVAPGTNRAARAARQTDGVPPSANRSGGGLNSPRAPVIKSRYHSLYNTSPRAATAASAATAATTNSNTNIQFAHDLETKTYNFLSPSSSIELNEQNWQEQIGNLLKCTVTNQIGTSEVCHVRVNLAERLKSRSSLSEFAKWRMPSLAHKSLLIVSILIGCSLIVFASLALLAGPYLRGLSLKRGPGEVGGGGSCKGEESNTGQSSSSQKSSVLGLLGNGGDSSIQGSSDDDSSARLNHLEHNSNNNQGLTTMSSQSASHTAPNGYHQHHHHRQQLLREPNAQGSGINYDQPRNLQPEPRVLYHSGHFTSSGGGLTSDGRNLTGAYDNYHYENGLVGAKLPPPTGNRHQSITEAPGVPEARYGPTKSGHVSASSRLLANLKLKSLSKFKVDRISDLSNLHRSLHTKNVSSSETSTTGLSSSSEIGAKLSPTSAASPNLFGAPSMRHSHTGFRRPTQQQQQMGRLEPSYYLFDQNGLHNNEDDPETSQLMQLSSQRAATSQPAHMVSPYSNMINNSSTNVLDEFIRIRELDSSLLEQQQQAIDNNNSAAFYRSQSVKKGQHQQPPGSSLYLLKNDLSQYYPLPQMSRGPPVGPRSGPQTLSSTLLYRQRLEHNSRQPPPVAARSSTHRQHPLMANVAQQYHQQQAMNNNRLSMPPYSHSFRSTSSAQVPAANMQPTGALAGYLDTIDSHLSRLAADSVTLGHYRNPASGQQIAYANAAMNTTTASYNNSANLQTADSSYADDDGDARRSSTQTNQSVEHIYDINTYATPEKTPLRRPNSIGAPQQQPQQQSGSERPRVSQLIQSFNSIAPE